MVWVMVSLFLCIISTSLIYLASPNQIWLDKNSYLSKKSTLTLRYLGLFGLVLSLIFAIQGVSVLSAVFIWLTAIMLLFGILPFLGLLKPKTPTQP